MELLKTKDHLTYSIGDVKFLIRPQMTVRDKFEIDMIGDYVDGKFRIDRGAIFRKVVELFVTGWDGVTEDGKPVPYSYATFMERIPGDVAEDWILKLGVFIVESIGLVQGKAEESKNESPAR